LRCNGKRGCTLIEYNQQILREWAKKHKMPIPEDARFIGSSFDNEVKAVVVYCGFFGKSCAIHVTGVGSHWITKDFLKAVFDYPFKQWKLRVIIGTVAGSNRKSLKLSRHLGFREVAVIPDAHDDGDLVIFEMRPTDCRFIGD